MNCKDFESIVLGLDRGEQAGMPVLEHAASCTECSEKLSAMRNLRRSLGALALQDAALEAPASVEAAILKAIRESPEPASIRFLVTKSRMPIRLWVGLAAAAAVLIAIAASMIYTRSLARGPAVPGRDPQEARERNNPDTSNRDNIKQHDDPVVPGPSKESVEPRYQRTGRDRVAEKRGTRDKIKPASESRPVRTDRDRQSSYEIATDFFPINFGSFLAPVDSGQIVRIKLPRSALRGYGLPVDPLRAEEAIKADVVIGNDGMARAIRFVH